MEIARAGTSHRRSFLRNTWRSLVGAGVLHGLVGQASQGASLKPSTQRLTVALTHRACLGQLPLVLARELGFFQAEGLSVDFLELESEAAAFQAVTKGNAALASCAYPALISLQARGQPWRSLVVQTRSPMAVLGVSPRVSAEIKGPADLRGRRVGVLSSGAGGMVLEAYLRRAGLTSADVVRVPGEQATGLIQAFRTGRLEAIGLSDVGVASLEQLGEIRVLADTRSQRGTREVFGGLFPGQVVCAPLSGGGLGTGIAQRVVDALVHTLKWIHTAGPSDLIRSVPEGHLAPDWALYLAAFEKARDGFSVDGVMPPDAPQTAFVAQKALDAVLMNGARVDLERTYTNEFAVKAKIRFRA